ELVRRYTPMVFSVAKRVTRDVSAAEDVTQECFFELAQKAARVHGASLAGWLYRTALNRSIDVRRKEDRRRGREAGAGGLGTGGPEISAWMELEPIVDEAIASLPEELRLPLVQHYLAGQSQADLAMTMGVTQPTISRRLDAAVTMLRQKLRSSGIVSAAAVPA